MVAINNWSKDRLRIESYKEGKKTGWRVSGTLPGGGRIRKRFSTKAEAEVEGRDKEFYPYLFRHEDSVWLYFLKRKDGRGRFYNHATSGVE